MDENNVIEKRKPYHMLWRTSLSYIVSDVNQNVHTQKNYFSAIEKPSKTFAKPRYVVLYLVS